MKIFGVFDADWILTLPALTAWLWSTGGSGFRPARRLGVPLALSLYAYGYGMTGWPLIVLLASTICLIGFGPGYGDDFEKKLKAFYWPYIFLLGAFYSLCQFPLVFHFGNFSLFWWMVLTNSFLFGGSLFASKKMGMEHKIGEMVSGLAVGLTAALIIK